MAQVLSPLKRAPFWRKRRNDKFAFYPLKTRASLFRLPKTMKMTKMAGVTHAKAWFRKSRVSSLIPLFYSHSWWNVRPINVMKEIVVLLGLPLFCRHFGSLGETLCFEGKISNFWRTMLLNREKTHRVLHGAPPRGQQLYITVPSAPDAVFKASEAPFLTLRVATPSWAPHQAPPWKTPKRTNGSIFTHVQGPGLWCMYRCAILAEEQPEGTLPH